MTIKGETRKVLLNIIKNGYDNSAFRSPRAQIIDYMQAVHNTSEQHASTYFYALMKEFGDPLISPFSTEPLVGLSKEALIESLKTCLGAKSIKVEAIF